MFASDVDANNFFAIWFREEGDNGRLEVLNFSTTYDMRIETTQVFRDVSAWYHLVVAIDTTQATSTNRVKIYINGSQVTALSTTTYPSQNFETDVNNTNSHKIGVQGSSYGRHNGYLTEVNFIDGQALTPSSFGETDSATGVWKPKAYTGTYGTNGFFLKFADNSGTTSTTLGKDSSGNGNNWTPNNFSVTAGVGNDSLVDSPTAYGTDTGVGGSVRGNYATLNPLIGSGTLSNGNLQYTGGAASDTTRPSTFGVTSGKWYAEITVTSALSTSSSLGLAIYNQTAVGTTNASQSRGYFYTGQKFSNGSVATYGSSFTNGDIIGVAIDLDNGKVWFSKNGTWQASGDPAAGTNAAYTDLGTTSTWFVTVQTGGATGGATCHANFGQRAFAYTAPSGFKALCTTNLPTPTIGATSTTLANDYFNPVLYTGNGSTLAVTGVGFQPDFVWLKSRGGARSHRLWDAIRGATKGLSSDLTNAEYTESGLTSFDSDGFTLGSQSGSNTNAETFVAWNWNAGGSNATNTSGTITSTVRANTTSGFSIVTYTGTGSNATVGHGLGVAPAMYIVKRRTGGVGNWAVWHNKLANTTTSYILLDSTAAESTSSSLWGSTAATSTTIGIGTSVTTNNSTDTYVAYCFAPVAGYSAFGSYTGNGSTDGPFVFTNFRPRFVIVKRTSGIEKWYMMDTARDTDNPIDITQLVANASDAEGTFTAFDFTSNGFKNRTSNVMSNGNGDTYIYMAFAENPFKYSLAR
jgi:hypothetical protein